MTRDCWKHMVLILGTIIVLAPFYMMVSYSFKSPGEIDQGEGGFFDRQEMMIDPRCVALRQPWGAAIDAARERFPGEDDAGMQAALLAETEAEADCSMRPVVFNYSKAFTEAPLMRYLPNGVIVAMSIFLIQIVLASPATCALAKLKLWGREAVFGLALFCLLIPVHAIALPLYIGLAKLGLTNT